MNFGCSIPQIKTAILFSLEGLLKLLITTIAYNSNISVKQDRWENYFNTVLWLHLLKSMISPMYNTSKKLFSKYVTWTKHVYQKYKD